MENVIVKEAKKTTAKKATAIKIKSCRQDVEIKNGVAHFESEKTLSNKKVLTDTLKLSLSNLKRDVYSVLKMTEKQCEAFFVSQEIRTPKDKRNYKACVLFSMYREQIEKAFHLNEANRGRKLKRYSVFNPLIDELQKHFKDDKIETLKYFYGKESK